MIKYLIQTVGTHGVNFVQQLTHEIGGVEKNISAADLSVAVHCTSVIPPITANDCFQKEPSTSSVHTSSSSSSTPTRTFEHWNLSRYFCCLSASSLLVTTFSYAYLLSFEVVVLHAVAITLTRCFAPSRIESAPRSALQNLDSTPLNR